MTLLGMFHGRGPSTTLLLLMLVVVLVIGIGPTYGRSATVQGLAWEPITIRNGVIVAVAGEKLPVSIILPKTARPLGNMALGASGHGKDWVVMFFIFFPGADEQIVRTWVKQFPKQVLDTNKLATVSNSYVETDVNFWRYVYETRLGNVKVGISAMLNTFRPTVDSGDANMDPFREMVSPVSPVRNESRFISVALHYEPAHT